MTPIDYTAYHFETRSGLPPDGEPGQFFGFDENGAAYILRWQKRNGFWGAVGFDPDSFDSPIGDSPLLIAVRGDKAHFIKTWSRAPALWSDVLPPETSP